MNYKYFICILLFILPVLTFSNAVSNLTTDIDFSFSKDFETFRSSRKVKDRTLNGVTMSFIGNNMIIYSVPFGVGSGFLVYFSSILLSSSIDLYERTKNTNSTLSNIAAYLVFLAAIYSMGSAALMLISGGLLIGGIVLSVLGAINFNKVRGKVTGYQISRRYKFYEYTALITGIMSAVGTVLGGIGAGMFIYDHYYNQDGNIKYLFDAGIYFSSIGGVLFAALPVAVTSLAYRSWLKGVRTNFSINGGINKPDSFYLSFNLQF